ncbi:MAG: hypothetical protein IPN33_17835 [Saprospiraceae bacterium]|nr:hypothetical protein [Saprospiraceae bacterium]
MAASKQQHIDTLQEIRSLMERSSRFISLSGLSGIFAGIWALAGATAAYIYLDIMPFDRYKFYYTVIEQGRAWGISFEQFFALDALIVLLGALGSGVYFTTRRAKRRGQKIWDPVTRRLIVELAIPLFTGGVFCLILLYHGAIGFVAPATLVFYGLALVNASKYTLPDVRLLGLSEIVLGLIALFRIGNGLECWAAGFGLLHIVYGAMMYYKYERNVAQS